MLTFSLACPRLPRAQKHRTDYRKRRKTGLRTLVRHPGNPQGVLVTRLSAGRHLKILKRYLSTGKGTSRTRSLPMSYPCIPLENVAVAHSTQIGLIAAPGMRAIHRSIGSRGSPRTELSLAKREDLGEFFNGWQFDTRKTVVLSPMPYSSPRTHPKTSPRSRKASAYRCSTTFPLGKTTRWPAANG